MRGNGKVFISHAHEDNARCEPLLRALGMWGVDYWFDSQRLDAGDDLSQRIQRAITERDVFLRVCTAAGQKSYWVRLETGAARGLQAEAHGRGEDGARVLINLILDAEYVREPFDYATVYIDAATLPESVWREDLRRALDVPASNAPDSADALGDALTPPRREPAPPPFFLPRQKRPSAPSNPPPRPAATAPDGTPAPIPGGGSAARSGTASASTFGDGIPAKLPARRRIPLVALVGALVVLVALGGVAAASGGGLFAGGAAKRSTATVGKVATHAPTATATLGPTATPSPPAGFQWITDGDPAANQSANFQFLAPAAWNVYLLPQGANSCCGPFYNVRVALSQTLAGPGIYVSRVSHPPSTEIQLLNYFVVGNESGPANYAKVSATIAGTSWIGASVHISDASGNNYDDFTYVYFHAGYGFLIQLQENDARLSQDQIDFDEALRSFRFLT